MRRARAAAQFMDFVEVRGDHWLWIGPVGDRGHGVWSYAATRAPAHRFSLEQKLGRKLKPGAFACHARECPFPNCVNPACLYEGTPQSNTADHFAVLQMRFPGKTRADLVREKFSGYPRPALAEHQSAHKRFRAWLDETGLSQIKAARLLGCDQANVSVILAGRRNPGLRLAFAIQEASANWEHGPLYAREWVEAEEHIAPSTTSSHTAQ